MFDFQKRLKQNFGKFLVWELESVNDAFVHFYNFENKFCLALMFNIEETRDYEFITWITITPLTCDGKTITQFSSESIEYEVDTHKDNGYDLFEKDDEDEIITFISNLKNYFENEKN